MTHFNALNDDLNNQVGHLLDQLSLENPIRPLKGFYLNFSTILGLFGLITTYTIVMLQFKIEENKP